MPIYDYVCASCAHRMEVMHGVHGHGPSACPICGGQMRKAFAPPAVHFKGSGWAKKERSSTTSKAKAPKSEGHGADSGPSGAPKGGSGDSAPPASSSTSSDASKAKD